MIPIINELPKAFEAHLVLEITPSFRLILYWKRLAMDVGVPLELISIGGLP